MEVLNIKQRAFADEYIINGGNATQAAITAGYSEKTAYSQGQRLLKNVEVEKYIESRVKEIQDERILKQKDILVMLSEIGAGKIPEVKEVITKRAEFIDDPDGIPTLVYNETAAPIVLPTKNGDRIRALETLGKFYKLWTDKTDIKQSGELQHNVIQLTPEERERRIKELKAKLEK